MVISNFDAGSPEFYSEIEEAEENLKGRYLEEVEHCAWDFYAFITFDGNVFTSTVKQYRQIVDTITKPSLKELIVETNNRYGWD